MEPHTQIVEVKHIAQRLGEIVKHLGKCWWGADGLGDLQAGLTLIPHRLGVVIPKLCTPHVYKNTLRSKTAQAPHLSSTRPSFHPPSHSSRVHKRASVAI